jgi:hypothetical protein
MTALSELFFTISGLSDCHGVDLVATGYLYFSLEDRSSHKDEWFAEGGDRRINLLNGNDRYQLT